MTQVLSSLLSATSQGVLWGIMALGVYITYRTLNVSDLTVDGSFATGGAVCAILIVNGVNPVISILIAIIAGMITGVVTGILITYFEIPAILAGILTQIGLYSINLRIMARSNLPLLRVPTLFKSLSELTGLNQTLSTLLVGVIISIMVISFLYWFFGTEIGSAIRATGNNERMASALGVNTSAGFTNTKILGLMISNGLIALSGALVTQSQGYADVKMGTGAIVIGLASIVIGEVVFGSKHSFSVKLMSIVIGSIVYRIIIAIVLQFGLNTDDLKLLTALLVGISLAVPILVGRSKQVGTYKRLTKEGQNNA